MNSLNKKEDKRLKRTKPGKCTDISHNVERLENDGG
jgi:hypothetical protein